MKQRDFGFHHRESIADAISWTRAKRHVRVTVESITSLLIIVQKSIRIEAIGFLEIPRITLDRVDREPNVRALFQHVRLRIGQYGR